MLQTACLSIGVGTACTLYQPFIVLEAVVLTASIVVGLTAYTFYAARKGANFRYTAARVATYTCDFFCLVVA